MLASYHGNYGLPHLIKIKKFPKPNPNDSELLVKIQSTTINRTDCGLIMGKPFFLRFISDFPKPKLKITGTDFAGTVEEVGSQVSRFKKGDRVFGFDDLGLQTHAQYAAIDQKKAIALIPEGIDFDTAASSIEGAHYAYNYIRKLDFKSGQRVMLIGATGAIGNAALQIMKSMGIHVVATCPGNKFELIQSLGAEKTIDYQKEDFTQLHEEFDFVFDSVGKSRYRACKRILRSGGIYISSELGPGAENLYLPFITAIATNKKVKFPVPTDRAATLKLVSELLGNGKFKPLIDKTVGFDELKESFEYVNSGRKTGNVILKPWS